jgi:hypothetical protein
LCLFGPFEVIGGSTDELALGSLTRLAELAVDPLVVAVDAPVVDVVAVEGRALDVGGTFCGSGAISPLELHPQSQIRTIATRE